MNLKAKHSEKELKNFSVKKSLKKKEFRKLVVKRKTEKKIFVKKKKKKNVNILTYITERWGLFLFSGIVLYFLFGIILRGNLKSYLLNKNPEITKAVIVNEENYWGNSPVSKKFSYSYEFTVGEKKYREDSRNEKLKIGDSVLIEYVNSYPNFSRIKE